MRTAVAHSEPAAVVASQHNFADFFLPRGKKRTFRGLSSHIGLQLGSQGNPVEVIVLHRSEIKKLGPMTNKEHIVVLSGAGMSAESGLKTFRDSGGLWEEYDVYEVATPEAWAADPKKVLHFYNLRRRQLLTVEPNAAHRALVELELAAEVSVITQNIDDLHERAGSASVLHLHGELRKARSVQDPDSVYAIEGGDLNWGDLAPDGAQLRPHVVWFGEMVPMMEPAAELVQRADRLLVIGTSLNVYPAASLVHEVNPGVPMHVFDPGTMGHAPISGAEHIRKPAGEGLSDWVKEYLAKR